MTEFLMEKAIGLDLYTARYDEGKDRRVQLPMFGENGANIGCDGVFYGDFMQERSSTG
mgnify:CR=1 FL=1